MSGRLIICTSAVLAIAAVSYWTAEVNIEQAKQQGFMMKACVDAGGSWKRDGWTAYYNCERPRP